MGAETVSLYSLVNSHTRECIALWAQEHNCQMSSSYLPGEPSPWPLNSALTPQQTITMYDATAEKKKQNIQAKAQCDLLYKHDISYHWRKQQTHWGVFNATLETFWPLNIDSVSSLCALLFLPELHITQRLWPSPFTMHQPVWPPDGFLGSNSLFCFHSIGFDFPVNSRGLKPWLSFCPVFFLRSFPIPQITSI